MSISTWGLNAVVLADNYDLSTDWIGGIPGASNTGFFGTSNNTNVEVGSSSDEAFEELLGWCIDTFGIPCIFTQ